MMAALHKTATIVKVCHAPIITALTILFLTAVVRKVLNRAVDSVVSLVYKFPSCTNVTVDELSAEPDQPSYDVELGVAVNRS